MKRSCADCNSDTFGPDPKFCAQCGSKLQKEEHEQVIERNAGNALNLSSSVIHGGVNLVSQRSDSIHEQFNADLEPTNVTRGTSINKGLGVSAFVSVIGFASSVFTIFGTNIFDFAAFIKSPKPIPNWLGNIWFQGSAALFIVAFAHILFFLWLKHVKEFRWFGADWLNISGKAYCVRYKRFCPRCGGVMDPKFAPCSDEKGQYERMWVCRNNHRLHRLDYDPTQIDRAWSEGKFNHLFENL